MEPTDPTTYPKHVQNVLALPRARELIGVVPDQEAAAALRIHVWLLRRVRAALGLPSVRPASRPRISKDWIGVFLEQHPEIREQLGIVPDLQLSERYKISPAKIREIRTHLGVPSSRDRGMWERRAVPPDLRAKMGTIPDSELARQYGLHQTTITGMRNRLGIPVFDPNPDRRPPPRTSTNEAIAALREEWERRTGRGSNELAVAMGVLPITVYDSTSGRRHPSIGFVWRMAQVVGARLTLEPDGRFAVVFQNRRRVTFDPPSREVSASAASSEVSASAEAVQTTPEG